MAEFEGAVLIGSEISEYPRIDIIHPEFIVGRSRSSSFIIRNLAVSKTHCIFKKADGIWTLCDKSSYGTYVNHKRLQKDEPSQIRGGDEISFGPSSYFKYVFYTKGIAMPSAKRMRLDVYTNSEEQAVPNNGQVMESKVKKHTAELERRHVLEGRKQLQDRPQSRNMEHQNENLELEHQQAQDRTLSQQKLLQEKQLLEEKLKEMQNLLEEKDKGEELLRKQLQEKEEQRLLDLKQLQEQKDAQARVMLEELKNDVAEKEELIKIQLAREIQRLQEDKLKIENNIQEELTKNGQSAENLKQLKEELEKVKTDLSNAEGKKQYLQNELEQITKAKEDAESRLKAKQDVLANLGELVEAELLCSICSELFVTATTLNCAHTFCHSCIVEWQKKEKTCPICRTKITSQNRSLVFDNFIDRMVENLSVEMKNRRQEVIEDRQVRELLGPKSSGEPCHRPQRLRRSSSQSSESTSSSHDHSRDNSSDFQVSSASSTGTESESSSSYDSEYTSDESSVEGTPSAYYGGYGCCYRCGRRGHWARGCPYR